jgi:hypothetical protein
MPRVRATQHRAAGSLAEGTGQGAGRHARAQHVRAQLRGPVDGQVLVSCA